MCRIIYSGWRIIEYTVCRVDARMLRCAEITDDDHALINYDESIRFHLSAITECRYPSVRAQHHDAMVDDQPTAAMLVSAGMIASVASF